MALSATKVFLLAHTGAFCISQIIIIIIIIIIMIISIFTARCRQNTTFFRQRWQY